MSTFLQIPLLLCFLYLVAVTFFSAESLEPLKYIGKAFIVLLVVALILELKNLPLKHSLINLIRLLLKL